MTEQAATFVLQTLANIAKMPPLSITRAELDALPEYSTTFPTGTVVGKRWKLAPWARLRIRQHPDQWIVAEYAEHPNPALVAIRYYRPQVNAP